MRKQIEALFYGRRWRDDEHAWGQWQNLAALVPSDFAALNWGQPVAGRIYSVHQRARRGTKAVVHFGDAVGSQDTWWEQMWPEPNQWVVVRTHLWFPPGTHSGEHVVWIDSWDSRAGGDVFLRAQRHEQKLAKEGVSLTAPPGQPWDVAAEPAQPVPPGQIFRMDAFATAAGMDDVMAAARALAEELNASFYGPAAVGGGRLLSVWPPDPVPTFISVKAKPIQDGACWVGLSVQSLAVDSLDVMDEMKATLESRLGSLDISPRPRELDYDRGAARRLESEIQELLESLAADPSSWDALSRTIFERELVLQHFTQLGA